MNNEYYKRNMYCFNNAIRHFFVIDKLIYHSIDLDCVKKNPLLFFSWSDPAKIRIKKDYDSENFRILKFPNLHNFHYALEKNQECSKFLEIDKINSNSRMKVNYISGTFLENSYSNELNKDLEILCTYDILMKLDIKSFYNSISTHDLGHDKDTFLSSMNRGSTTGLLMGNYLSLYWSEVYLNKIQELFLKKINNQKIDCEFSFFSDDFYVFANKKDEQNIRNIFNEVLATFELTENDDKYQVFTYEKYNNDNIIDRYWKTVVKTQRETNKHWDEICEEKINKCKEKKDDINKNKMYYYALLNQLIYRNSKLNNEKKQHVFINSFFKGLYWFLLDTSKYKFTLDNLHQTIHLYKKFPESILYIINKIIISNDDLKMKYTEKIKKLFLSSLDKQFQEYQVYYFYACMKTNAINNLNNEEIDKIIKSDNQILLSMIINETNYLDSHIFLKDSKNNYINLYSNQEYWIINYHIILKILTEQKENLNYIDKLIEKYLIPSCKKQGATKLYIEFYQNNIHAKNHFIAKVSDIDYSIVQFLKIRNKYNETETQTLTLSNHES